MTSRSQELAGAYTALRRARRIVIRKHKEVSADANGAAMVIQRAARFRLEGLKKHHQRKSFEDVAAKCIQASARRWAAQREAARLSAMRREREKAEAAEAARRRAEAEALRQKQRARLELEARRARAAAEEERRRRVATAAAVAVEMTAQEAKAKVEALVKVVEDGTLVGEDDNDDDDDDKTFVTRRGRWGRGLRRGEGVLAANAARVKSTRGAQARPLKGGLSASRKGRKNQASALAGVSEVCVCVCSCEVDGCACVCDVNGCVCVFVRWIGVRLCMCSCEVDGCVCVHVRWMGARVCLWDGYL